MRFDVIYCRADSTEHALYLLNRLIGNELIPKLISEVVILISLPETKKHITDHISQYRVLLLISQVKQLCVL